MQAKTMLRCIGKTLCKRGAMPEYATLYVTSKCNCRCAHCFYWKELNRKEKELSVEEMEKFSKSMGDFSLLVLTGGEPFLRKELPEIAETFCRNNSVENILIPTNGFDAKRISETTKKMLEKCQKTSIVVNVSIDGIGKTHDKIRGGKGLFERAMKTFNALKALKKEYKNLSVGFNVTHFAENGKGLEKTIDYLIERKPDSVSLGLVRGKTKKDSEKNIDLALHERLCKKIMKEMRGGRMGGHSLAGSKFISKMRISNTNWLYEEAIRTARTGKMSFPCYAGTINAIIYSNGDVFPCELLEKRIGNIRDYGYDFKKLWNSKSALETRRFIAKKGCACTQECIITTNLLFNPLCLVKMGLESL